MSEYQRRVGATCLECLKGHRGLVDSFGDTLHCAKAYFWGGLSSKLLLLTTQPSEHADICRQHLKPEGV